jgi:hypothetical protein
VKFGKGSELDRTARPVKISPGASCGLVHKSNLLKAGMKSQPIIHIGFFFPSPCSFRQPKSTRRIEPTSSWNQTVRSKLTFTTEEHHLGAAR